MYSRLVTSQALKFWKKGISSEKAEPIEEIVDRDYRESLFIRKRTNKKNHNTVGKTKI
jgi:hypothetical protein